MDPNLTSDDLAELVTALARAQGEFPPIPKDRSVKVQTKTGGSYSFEYATLDSILSTVRPALAANGLALTSLVTSTGLRTVLLHSLGQWIGHDLPLVHKDNPQEYGSELTYKRRYGIVALLGVAADEDDDGNTASGNQITERVERHPPLPRPSIPTSKPAPVMASPPNPDPRDIPFAATAEETKRELLKAIRTVEVQLALTASHQTNCRKKHAGTDQLEEATSEGLRAYLARLLEYHKEQATKPI